jgi:Lysine 2,3-aminomutase
MPLYHPKKVAIDECAHRLLQQLLDENPRIKEIYATANNDGEAKAMLQNWAMEILAENPTAFRYYTHEKKGKEAFEQLRWEDFAAIRILDYIDNAGREIDNPYRKDTINVSDPFKILWWAIKQNKSEAKPPFFQDLIFLFRQLTQQLPATKPTKENVLQWMNRWETGLDEELILIRKKNKARIIELLIQKINRNELSDTKYNFPPNCNHLEKVVLMNEWWNEHLFHLRFAVRSPQQLNELLGNSLDSDTLQLLEKAEAKGIPFFVNPYYLSLLNTDTDQLYSDLAIRHYVIYSKQLIDEFGQIEAWEKEDMVELGKPNAAGWLLPSTHSIHRRYPEVAIFIPETMGRACGGLCSSCQRMYDFQRGNLNFNLEKLTPKEKWEDKLTRHLSYYEYDTQLRDILITGGDALMSRNASLERILEAVYQMAWRKREANKKRANGEKYAEIIRIRLGTRLPAYLPQRITTSLATLLANFRKKASKIGIKQFIIQTHFESPLEITPESKMAIDRLIGAGWTITNQLVFTAAASRRGHTAKLRQTLNELGVLTYYTFSVKGFRENTFNYATNARTVQEQVEEKSVGRIPLEYNSTIKDFTKNPEKIKENIKLLQQNANLPFLATDRNVMNLPGVGKSLTFRTIGITITGRRILEFTYDPYRRHSPVVDKQKKVIIVESKTISDYLQQLKEMGEDEADYLGVWGYSIGETEPVQPIFEYPNYSFQPTTIVSNIVMGDKKSDE